MNKKHKKITLTIQTENDSFFHFLNFKICKQKDKFIKIVFKKDKFSGLYIDFNSFRALKHNIALA